MKYKKEGYGKWLENLRESYKMETINGVMKMLLLNKEIREEKLIL